ncbi:hypothetical protein MferCBS31731_003788 [Microsporum ferrugineum]
MEVWSGAIDSGPTTPLTGIRLIDPNFTNPSNLFRNAKLSFRAYVNPSRIPIVCFTGPSLELHCSEHKTVDWIRHKLLRTYRTEGEDYEELAPVQQCPVGILIRVDEQSPSPEANNNTSLKHQMISDILIFGTLSRPSPRNDCPSSPQPSSMTADGQLPKNEPPPLELRVYAIPLCSSNFTRVQLLSTPPVNSRYSSAGIIQNESSGEFLPDSYGSSSPKRKRVATLFEAAAEYHKNVRRKGAAAMSEYFTREKSATPQFPLLPSNIRIKRENENNPEFSSSLNDVNLTRKRATSVAKDIRAGSRRPSLLRPRSSMSQVLCTSSRKELPSSKADGSNPQSQQSQQSKNPNLDPLEDIAANNKALLTRTILTCMRLYGFRRPNTRTTSNFNSSSTIRHLSSPNDTVIKCDPEEASGSHRQDIFSHANFAQLGDLGKMHTPNPVDGFDEREPKPEADGDDDMEFREIYHATYRASTFALRRFLKPSNPAVGLPGNAACAHDVPILGKDKAMNTVDSVLKLFCEASDGE